MKKIEAYKLSDGSIVENKLKASIAERDIQFKIKLNDLIEKEVEYETDKHNVKVFIENNQKELFDMLNG